VFPFLSKAEAQDSFSVRAQRYIEQYYTLAMKEQMRSGVPASVTLAQGVLETEAGRSELACMANNHFGIKCKPEYSGDKFYHDDDAPKECFKMYRSAEDSYVDHSDYLKRNPRYNPLFTLSITDYAAWAMGLKRCGYATSPTYAQRLIRIIEDFRLQEYTYSALDSLGINVPPKFSDIEKQKFQMQLNKQEDKSTNARVNNRARLTEHEKEAPQVQTIAAKPEVQPATVAAKSVGAARLSDHEKEKPQLQVAKVEPQPVKPIVPAARLQLAAAPPAKTDTPDKAAPVTTLVAPAPAPKDTLPPATVAQPVAPAVQPAPAAPQPVAAIKTDTPLAVKREVPTAPPVAVAVKDTVKAVVAEEKPRIAAIVQSQPAAPVAPATDSESRKPAAEVNDTHYDSGKVIVVNGLKAFYAKKGEMLLQYAVKYNIRYPHLLEINDLPDAALTVNTLVYLEKKLNSGTHLRHTVREDETIYTIAQTEGIVLKRLLTLNMLDPGEEPAAGTILELQNGATRKPTLRAIPPPDLNTAHNLSYVKPTPPDAYVNIERHTPEPPAGTEATGVKDISRDKYVSTIQVGIDTAQQAANIAAKQPQEGTPQATDAVTDNGATATNKALDSILTADTTDASADALAALKARLDKVVYTKRDSQEKQPQKVNQPVAADTAGHEPIRLTTSIFGPVPPPKKGKPVAAQSNSSAYYTVKKGDNFSRIAQKNHVSVNQIMKLNKIEPDELKPGQKIRIR
jgi:LysM repeat protein